MARISIPRVMILLLVTGCAGGALERPLKPRDGAPPRSDTVPVLIPEVPPLAAIPDVDPPLTDPLDPARLHPGGAGVGVFGAPPLLVEGGICDPEVLFAGRWSPSDTSARSPPKPPFTLLFDGEENPYRIMTAFTMPGEQMVLQPVPQFGDQRFRVSAAEGELAVLGGGRWGWRAPLEPGLYCLAVTDLDRDETMLLNVVVMLPYDGAPVFNGYRMGLYQAEALRDDPTYTVPIGLIEVTEENADLWVTPHFQLGQFTSKQTETFPKYMVLRTRLLLKLEKLLEEIRFHPIPARSFVVMSGYRTPYYNERIGNETGYSRHAYGDAADIYIDQDGDGVIDDLDGDGAITRLDAYVLYALVDRLSREAWFEPFLGGLGLYGPAPHRGPFIHVDTRGYEVRWGHEDETVVRAGSE